MIVWAQSIPYPYMDTHHSHLTTNTSTKTVVNYSNGKCSRKDKATNKTK